MANPYLTGLYTKREANEIIEKYRKLGIKATKTNYHVPKPMYMIRLDRYNEKPNPPPRIIKIGNKEYEI